MADAYEAVFTALAHPARRRILISVNFAGGEMKAAAIAGLFAHAWPTTTRPLQALAAAVLAPAAGPPPPRLVRARGRRALPPRGARARPRVYALDKARLALARD